MSYLSSSSVKWTGATFTASINRINLIDATAQNTVGTIPASTTWPNAQLTLKRIDDPVATSHTVTINLSGSDTFTTAPGTSTSTTLTIKGEALTLQSDGANGITVISHEIPKSYLDATYGAGASYITASQGSTLFAPIGMPTFTTNTVYPANYQVQYQGSVFLSKYAFTSTSSFVQADWQPVSDISGWQMQDVGYLAWNYNPYVTANTTVLTSGTPICPGFPVYSTATITHASFGVGVAGTGSGFSFTTGQCGGGIYSFDGSIQYGTFSSADVITALSTVQTASIPITETTTGSMTLVPGRYRAHLFANWTLGSGTAPALSRQNATAGLANGSLTGANALWCTGGTNITATPATIASLSSSSFTFWVGLK